MKLFLKGGIQTLAQLFSPSEKQSPFGKFYMSLLHIQSYNICLESPTSTYHGFGACLQCQQLLFGFRAF